MPQAVPQAPQLALLVCRSTQEPLHAVSPPPGGHEFEPPQTPPEQTGAIAGHMFPQAPQFLGSPAMTVHTPLQGAL
jgi:hypothetical protein